MSVLEEKWLSSDEEVRFMAEARQKAIMDYNARYDGGVRDGKALGRMEVAENALRKNMSVSDIAEITGLSLAEVEALAARLNRGDS